MSTGGGLNTGERLEQKTERETIDKNKDFHQ